MSNHHDLAELVAVDAQQILHHDIHALDTGDDRAIRHYHFRISPLARLALAALLRADVIGIAANLIGLTPVIETQLHKGLCRRRRVIAA